MAGGSGTRLAPTTLAINKHLLPVYDKPMLFYPLSTLMMAGIRSVDVVLDPKHIASFKRLLGNGERLGMEIHYVRQEQPRGIAEAFTLLPSSRRNSPCCLILGDNVFHGSRLGTSLAKVSKGSVDRATVFAYEVSDPSRFAVVTLTPDGHPVDIEEKPTKPKSHWAVPGLYFYPPDVFERSKALQSGPRGELEITDINVSYLEDGLLNVARLPRGAVWIDAGTPDALHEAAGLIRTISKLHGLAVACPEEIALRNEWISESQFMTSVTAYSGSAYGRYLESVILQYSTSSRLDG